MIFDNLDSTHIFAFLAIVVSFIRLITYLISIKKGEAKPHVFSWFNWGLINAIATTAQFNLDGGLSAWVLATLTGICFFIALCALFAGEKNITQSDKATFIAALAIIPLWQITGNPFIAVLAIILIDGLSYYPTIRKSWSNPWSEPAFSYFWAGLRYFLILFTIENHTFENTAYITFLMLVDWCFMCFLIWRKKVLEPCAV